MLYLKIWNLTTLQFAKEKVMYEFVCFLKLNNNLFYYSFFF